MALWGDLVPVSSVSFSHPIYYLFVGNFIFQLFCNTIDILLVASPSLSVSSTPWMFLPSNCPFAGRIEISVANARTISLFMGDCHVADFVCNDIEEPSPMLQLGRFLSNSTEGDKRFFAKNERSPARPFIAPVSSDKFAE